MNSRIYNEAVQMVARGEARNFREACSTIAKRPHRRRQQSNHLRFAPSNKSTFQRPAYWDE